MISALSQGGRHRKGLQATSGILRRRGGMLDRAMSASFYGDIHEPRRSPPRKEPVRGWVCLLCG